MALPKRLIRSYLMVAFAIVPMSERGGVWIPQRHDENHVLPGLPILRERPQPVGSLNVTPDRPTSGALARAL